MKLPLAKSIIKRRIGNPTKADILTTIEEEMALVQETLLEQNGRIVPWFLESEVSSTTLIVGDERVAIPADFIREKAEGGIFLYDATDSETPFRKLEKLDYSDIVLKYQQALGTPEAYSLSGQYIRLAYIPDEEFVLKMIYTARATSVAGGGTDFENVWLKYAPDLFIAETSKVMAEKVLQDFDLAATFVDDIKRGWDRVWTDTEGRNEENRERSTGEAP